MAMEIKINDIRSFTSHRTTLELLTLLDPSRKRAVTGCVPPHAMT